MRGNSINSSIQIHLPTESCSIQLAEQCARVISAPMTLAFSGEIGAGKTTLIRAMLRALGIESAIKSPTFSLVETYQTKTLLIHHFDLYRIHDEIELEYIGFRDYFKEAALCCIEWPEQVPSVLSQVDLRWTLSLAGTGRIVQIQAVSQAGDTLLARLKEVLS